MRLSRPAKLVSAVLLLVVPTIMDGGVTLRGLRPVWPPRISAPLAAVAVSGDFFGFAFAPAFRGLLYFGGLCLGIEDANGRGAAAEPERVSTGRRWPANLIPPICACAVPRR